MGILLVVVVLWLANCAEGSLVEGLPLLLLLLLLQLLLLVSVNDD